jgi:PAS domain S-box-containing protein
MSWEYFPYTLPLLVSSGLLLLLGVISWRRRPAPGSVSFAALMWSTAWWAGAHAFEIGAGTLEGALFWSKVLYLGSYTVPTTWLIFALEYSGLGRYLTRRTILLLAIMPALTQIVVWTNDLHGLNWRNISLDTSGPFPTMAFARGPFYVVNTVYSYILIGAATLLILHAFMRVTPAHRKQAAMVLAGAFVPLLMNVIYLMGFVPVPGWDLTAPSFAVTGILISWALFRYGLLQMRLVERGMVLGNLRDGVIVIDVEGRIIDINPAAARIVETEGQDVIGQPVGEALADWPLLIGHLQQKGDIHTRVKLGDHIFDLSVSALKDSNGIKVGRLIDMHDVTGSVNAEEARRQSEERYRALFEQAQDAIILENRDEKIIDANPAASEMFGYSYQELLNMTTSDLETPDLRHISPRQTYRMPDPISDAFEYTLQNQRGMEIPAEITLAPLKTGEETLFLSIIRDITGRKKAEEESRQAYERMAILRRVDDDLTRKLDIDYVLMMALDAALRLSFADAGFIALAEGDQLRVVTTSGHYDPDIEDTYLPTEGSIFARVMHERQAEWVRDVQDDADYVQLLDPTQSLIAIPLISPERFIGVLSLETATSERFTEDKFESLQLLAARIAVALDNARMYEESKLLIEDLDAFSHTVAHDLKNPLGGILGYAELLEMQADSIDRERQRYYLNSIIRGIRKMESIINELLLLANVRKLEDVEVTRLDMGRIVDEALERLKAMVSEYDADIVRPDWWPEAYGYASWVEEIWANYISNALKYGGRPPRVELGATREGDMVRFWVRDNGGGLTPEECQKLFSQFTRLSAVQDIEGNGLGLSIVQRIAKKLGGDVGVESEAGRGSTFSFTLPDHAEKRRATSEIEMPPPQDNV